ncbi:MAG: glycosyltransferase family 8 protein [Alphaproteobacteria bacterium]|nr:glycosyltransferase family 8 protein [Alphaproteobacteria bacterium]
MKTDVEMIPVVTASNDKYAVGVATLFYSILENTKAKIDFYVLDQDISAAKKELIKKSLKDFSNFNLTFINMDKFDLNRFPNIFHYSTSTFSRYFLADLLPQYDKIIYTDSDVIFKGDIADYYNIDLGKKGLAAVTEETGVKYNIPWNHEYRKELFGINPKHKYFAAGNIIISGEYWRKHKIADKLVAKTLERKDDLKAPDLDVMNMIFANKYKQLDLKYCVCCHAWEQRKVTPELAASFDNPFIIHYTGKKPWNNDKVPFSYEFLRVLEKTAFYPIRGLYGNQWTTIKKYKLFGLLPLLSIEEK